MLHIKLAKMVFTRSPFDGFFAAPSSRANFLCVLEQRLPPCRPPLFRANITKYAQTIADPTFSQG